MESKVDLSKLLTNEVLRKRFSNPFDLINYAKSIAENWIKAGKQPDPKADIMNVAYQILELIANGTETFESIEEKVLEEKNLKAIAEKAMARKKIIEEDEDDEDDDEDFTDINISEEEFSA
jgi:hypothetical protein